MTEDSPKPLFAPRAALRFSVLFLAAMAGVVAFSMSDSRQNLSTFSQNTGVEDRLFYVPPNPPPTPPEAVVTWQGRNLAPVSYEKEPKLHDTMMTPVGKDSESGLSIYKAGDKGEALFIKIGENDYLRLNTQ